MVLNIYEGIIAYNNIDFPKNLKIEIQINLSHHPHFSENGKLIKHLTTLETKFDEKENKYIAQPLPDPWIISYTYSGEKYLSATFIINGESVFSIQKELVTIEKSYVKSQVEMTRAVVTIALWTIFATLWIPIDKSINWYQSTSIDEHNDDSNNESDNDENIGYT